MSFISFTDQMQNNCQHIREVNSNMTQNLFSIVDKKIFFMNKKLPEYFSHYLTKLSIKHVLTFSYVFC